MSFSSLLGRFETMEDVGQYIKDNPYLVGGLTTATVLAFYLGIRRRSQRAADRDSYPPNTVILHTVKPGVGVPSMSPFPVKLECYMRLAKIPYMREYSKPFSPKGKVPWITYNGVDVYDTSFIVDFLNKEIGVDLNKGLTKEQRAVARSIQILTEDHLYWFLPYFRWMCYIDSPEVKHIVSGWFHRRVVARYVKNLLHGHGIGRHSHEEKFFLFRRDLGVLQDYLGNKPFLMGAEPTEVDCIVFGLVANYAFTFSDDPIKGLIEREFPTLYQYTLRMKQRVYPDDWEAACTEESSPTVYGERRRN